MKLLIFRKPFSVLVTILTISGVLLISTPVKAQDSLSGGIFGGMAVFSMSCTCSANTMVWFAPLYLGDAKPVAGVFVYSRYSTTQYAHNNAGKVGSWHLGAYSSSQSCKMYVGNSCVTFPTMGLMTRVGTSK